MSEETRKLRVLLEEAYSNQSYLESVPSHQRTDSWSDLYNQHIEYVEQLRNTYYKLSEHRKQPTIYRVK